MAPSQHKRRPLRTSRTQTGNSHTQHTYRHRRNESRREWHDNPNPQTLVGGGTKSTTGKPRTSSLHSLTQRQMVNPPVKPTPPSMNSRKGTPPFNNDHHQMDRQNPSIRNTSPNGRLQRLPKPSNRQCPPLTNFTRHKPYCCNTASAPSRCTTFGEN